MYVYIYKTFIHSTIHTYPHIHTQACEIYAYISINICTYTYIYIYIHIYIYIYIYIHTYIYIYIHTYIYNIVSDLAGGWYAHNAAVTLLSKEVPPSTFAVDSRVPTVLSATQRLVAQGQA